MDRPSLSGQDNEREVLRRLAQQVELGSGTLCVAVPDLVEAFNIAVCEGIARAAEARGMGMTIWLTRDDPGRLAEAAGMSQAVSGGLAVVSEQAIPEHLPHSTPTVSVTRKSAIAAAGGSAGDVITVGADAARQRALSQLASEGHQTIHLVDWAWRHEADRLSGVEEHGAISATVIPVGAAQALHPSAWVATHRPSACVIADDFAALNVLRVAETVGIAVPGDMDCIVLASLGSDLLTNEAHRLRVVDLRAREAGAWAVERLLHGPANAPATELSARWPHDAG